MDNNGNPLDNWFGNPMESDFMKMLDRIIGESREKRAQETRKTDTDRRFEEASREMAAHTYAYYKAFTDAGFTKDQAFELLMKTLIKSTFGGDCE